MVKYKKKLINMEQLIVKQMYESGCRLRFDECFSCTSWLKWAGGNGKSTQRQKHEKKNKGEKSDAKHLLPTVGKEAVVGRASRMDGMRRIGRRQERRLWRPGHTPAGLLPILCCTVM